ncbi:MAG: LysR family transcriptional regulator [Tepidiformaceae bacterium]
MSGLNIEDLRTLRLAAEFGSFSKAAEHLLITQPAVSQRIRHLERELGFDLFERTGRRVNLSDAGEVVLEFARDLDSLLVVLRQRLATTSLSSQTVTVGASAATAGFILPALYQALYARDDRARVRTILLPPEQVRAGVQRGEIDLAVLAAVHVPEDLHSEHLVTQRLLLVVHPGHPLAAQSDPIAIEQIAQEPWVTATLATQTRQMVRDWARIAGTVPRIVLEVDSHEAIGRAVKRGIGIGFVIESVAADDIREGRLISLAAPGGEPPPFEIEIGYNPAYTLSPSGELLLEVMRTTDWRKNVPSLP